MHTLLRVTWLKQEQLAEQPVVQLTSQKRSQLPAVALVVQQINQRRSQLPVVALVAQPTNQRRSQLLAVVLVAQPTNKLSVWITLHSSGT